MIKISGADLREKRLIRKVEKACFETVGQENFFTVDMTVVDTRTIRELNANFRGVDKVTDVPSFPSFEKLSLPVSKDYFSDCDFEGRYVMLGSIMICRERAEEQAREFGHSYARELGFLACHGILHILGYDHIQPEDEEIMTSVQREVMDKTGLKH